MLLPAISLWAQVTTSSITGVVKTSDGKVLEGATVTAIHQPSGTKYVVVAGKNGIYTMPSVRVGGPYTITASYTGFQVNEQADVFANLGTAANVDLTLTDSGTKLTEVVVTSTRSSLISSKRTGASTTFGREAISRIPTVGRTVNDITKYNPYGNGRSFAGQDPRYNNFTIDGSVFNNGFGLGSQAQAGGRTGSTAISLDALEEVQINIAPYDIRQSGFAGAGVNAVTRSGTNDFNGSAYYLWNNRDLAGDKADTSKVPQTPFETKTWGFRVGGPIIKNKLFFFANAEFVKSARPALDFVAAKPGAVGNQSRTTATDLNDLSSFLKTNLGYDLGAIDNFNNELNSDKFLIRLDYNISDKHKLSVRYANHNSQSDVIISNSSSGNLAGNGNRQNLSTAISGQNTGYIIQDNTRSIVAELNSTISSRFANQFLATYNKQIEDRKYRTSLFPTIDILSGPKEATYTSIGFDPFTPNNRLDYSTLNFTDNFTWFAGKHTITAGIAFEAFKSNNLFVPSSNGVWTFNSIQDFKDAVLAYKANPDLTVAPDTIARFNYRYSLLPEGQLPWQVFKTNTTSLYFQDEFKLQRNFTLTGGLRFDYVTIPNTAEQYYNPVVAGMTFKLPDGTPTKVNTGIMPKAHLYVSPRIGFNWDVLNNRTFQVRGGTGMFLSRMPYVLLSNQLGNNGVQTGVYNVQNTVAFPFTLDPSKYAPTTTDITKLSGYAINASDPNIKFPQIWKTNLAVDYRLPFAGIIATLEGIYNKSYNSLNYYDVNLNTYNGKFAAGPDTRPIYPALDLPSSAVNAARFINPQVTNVYVLTNNDKGHSYTLTAKLEKPITKAWGGMLAYTYGVARDISFVASTVNANVPTTTGVNYLTEANSDNDLRNRIVGSGSYRLTYGKGIAGATTFTLGFVSTNAAPSLVTGSNVSYIYSNDMNGDGQQNDLIFIPKKATDIVFAPITNRNTGAVIYTKEQQEAAFEQYINSTDYLSSRKGNYAERNGAKYPWLTRFDFSVEQDLIVKVGKSKKANTLRFRMDILNAGNLINHDWGVGYVTTTANPLTYVKRDAATGIPSFNLAQVTVNGKSGLVNQAFLKSKTIDDVYQIQFGLRYIFGN